MWTRRATATRPSPAVPCLRKGTPCSNADRITSKARTFAPLILASAVNRDTATGAGHLDATTVRRWLNGFITWWVAETDIRGWDDELGWLHAVAHGADLAGAFGESPTLRLGTSAGY